jgi:hypothetical protein
VYLNFEQGLTQIVFYRLANAQQKQQGLFDKQARLSRFASKAERDSWLNSEITELNNTIESLRQQVQIRKLTNNSV